MKHKIREAAIKMALYTVGNIEKKTGLRITYTKKKDDTELYVRLYGKKSVNNRLFFNVCAGGHGGFGGYFSHPCWTNVDVIAPALGNNWVRYNPKTDISHDLLEMIPLPIVTDSAEIIQSQYTIEHITTSAAKYFFKEVFRSLKPGGIFKVVAPNIELDYVSYLNNDKSFFQWVDTQSTKEFSEIYGNGTPINRASLEQIAIVHFAANASTIHVGGNPQRIQDEEFKHIMHTMKMEEAYDYCIAKCSIEIQKKYRANHINWWNHEKLIYALKEAGFRKIHILAPGQSSAPVLRNRNFFDNMWNEVALFVEATKE
jgi:SAM-dependent methyltransferase